MFFSRKKLEMPTADSALKGRADPIPTAKAHFLNKRALKGPYPDGLETAIFGLGFSGIIPAYVLAVRELFPAHEAGWRVPVLLCLTAFGMASGGSGGEAGD